MTNKYKHSQLLLFVGIYLIYLFKKKWGRFQGLINSIILFYIEKRKIVHIIYDSKTKNA